MSPEGVLRLLLDRLGANNGETILISEHELTQWPAMAVAALKAQQLLVKASPATSLVCPGCEDECVMSVNFVNYSTGRAAFIMCDRRSDVSRVSIPVVRLNQWQCALNALCDFIADGLNMHRRVKEAVNAEGWEIGIARGHKRSQMLCIKAEGGLHLIAGGNAMPLTELFGYQNGVYTLNGILIHQLVDAATPADPRYTPSNARREVGKLETEAMHEDWRKAYRKLRRQYANSTSHSDTWIARQIAKMDIARGRSAETIRKNMKS